ncbi:palmitoyl acyltransferase 6 [Novymonas esmeraldas]|uniref:Palmitoyltransferase n=1 Tax=Novymonas esmeraldas TaxID=1808958 RepID=A0AAW0EN45_9TRYP
MEFAASPATHNPGLANYLARVLLAGVFVAVFAFFTVVHFYYASAALLDLVVLLILFFFLVFFGLSVSSLVMCGLVGPGDLPSRFSAARMETFIRGELQRIIARAAAATSETNAASADAPLPNGSRSGGDGGGGGVAAAPAKTLEPKWDDVDEAERHQLANVASAAAIQQRSSRAAEETAQERAAVDARLRLYDVDADTASSHSGDEASEQQQQQQRRRRRRRRERGGGSDGDDGSGDDHDSDHSGDTEVVEDRPELPAYMTAAMLMRRHRKLRRGLEVVSVSQAARRVLSAIDGADMDSKQTEIGFLLPGANWCRFCNFYQMNDTRHCQVCGRCVYRSKLHCICCGQCIGYANSKFYVLFLLYMCLALVVADLLDLYCVSWGYAFFFKETGEANTIFYLVFVYSATFALAGLGLLVQYLYAAGRGIGLLTDVLQQQREEFAEAREHNNGVQYQPVLSERTMNAAEEGSASPVQEAQPFRWRVAMETIGDGLPLPMWFWPTATLPAAKETDDPPGFWEALTEAIRLRLRSVADEDDVFTDEDHDDVHDDDDRVLASPTPATEVAVPPPPPTITPREAASSDVALVAAVPTAASVLPPPPAAAAAVSVAAPPIAKVAPRHKAD